MKKAIIVFLCFVASNFAYGQNKKIFLEMVNGISMPNGNFKDFVEDGFNNELTLSMNFCDHLSLGIGLKHSSFNVREEFGQVQGSRQQFRSIGFDVGPQFSIGSDKISVKIYGRTGLAVNSTPELMMLHPITDITTSSLKQQSIMALSARVGAKINTELCQGIHLFLSSEYAASIHGDASFYSKNISKAVGADGRIDPDLAGEIPTTSSSFNFNSLNVNFGVSILMGRMGNHPNRRNSNPLYQANQNTGENPLYQQGISGDAGQTPGSKAQDYNSSRSNNANSISKPKDSENHTGVKAQDYNSSRSNTTAAIELEEDKDIVDKSNLKAQDYNSSRSNNSSGIEKDTDNGNIQGATKAQDYNSSRSNTTAAIELEEDKDIIDKSNLKAQDYNSSRSNNSSGIEKDTDNGNIQGATKAQDYNSSRSNTTAAIELEEDKDIIDKSNLKAQDYNSSRSNNSSGIEKDTDNGNTQGATKAQDYNSSRSNTTAAIELEEDKDIVDKSNLKAQDYNSSRSNNSSGIEKDTDNGNTQGATKAQDYNSSRSNTTAAIDTGDDIRESMTAREKRKIKRKLKKEERKRLKEEKKRRKLRATKVY
ncbi:hypothetical protein [Marinifilum sp.]|uniref:hypothetical protein n=1 Tax=Marinifilum sp. TaxID=2033137 RepID=UPI003BA9F7DB